MKQRVLSGVLALTLCIAGLARSQQTVAPPQPTAADPNLAVTMKALAEKLRSVGRVTVGASNTGYAAFEEMTSITADPKDCRLRIQWNDSGRQGVNDYYLEEITSVDVVPRGNTQLYSIKFSWWRNRPILFPNRESAEQAAGLVRQAVKECSEGPPTPLPTNASGPTLGETLNFIADKLDSQGKITWVTTSKERKEAFTDSVEYFVASTNLRACTMSVLYDKTKPGNYFPVSFRRIVKIEVIPWEEAMARVNDKDNSSYTAYRRGVQNIVSPETYVLRITTPDGGWRDLSIADETIADRLAKAMVHAADLCGGGSKPEPF